MEHFDAVIIGTGQAGPGLAGRLTESGQRVAIVERKAFGGTCVNTGCIPTKTLVASAYVARKVQQSAEYGVLLDGDFHVDMKLVKNRKDRTSSESRNGVAKWLKGMDQCTVYEGHARFVGEKQLQIGDETISGERVFLNVGMRAAVPPIPGLDQVPYLTNSSMMDIDFLPEHLLILGGSYIGLEFAQMYRRFGSRVTVVERGSRIAAKEDPDVSETIQEFLEKEEIRVLVDAECTAVSQDGDEIALNVKSPHHSGPVCGSHLLIATGRRPNTDDLGVEQTGVELDSDGYIKVNDRLETSAAGVWALGDCNRRGAFTHTSYNDFEIVAANLLDNGSRKISDRILAYAMYTDPPLGRAGMNKSQAKESEKGVLLGRLPMSKVGRAKEKGETEGFMEILIDPITKKIMGATVLGTGGDEVIHCLLDAMYADMPYTTLQRAVHIHPTVSELIPTMLGDLKPL